jgi:hypothetical protein
MKTWAEAAKGPEQRALLAWAESSGNLTEAARALGISRRWLTMLLSEMRRNSVHTGNSGNSENSILTEGFTPDGNSGTTENRSHVESLTYADAAPRLGGMSSAAANLTSTAEGEPLSLPNVPKDIKEWLEGEALRRKQAGLTRRPNMTLVVVDAIRALQERQKAGDK